MVLHCVLVLTIRWISARENSNNQQSHGSSFDFLGGEREFVSLRGLSGETTHPTKLQCAQARGNAIWLGALGIMCFLRLHRSITRWPNLLYASQDTPQQMKSNPDWVKKSNTSPPTNGELFYKSHCQRSYSTENARQNELQLLKCILGDFFSGFLEGWYSTVGREWTLTISHDGPSP